MKVSAEIFNQLLQDVKAGEKLSMKSVMAKKYVSTGLDPRIIKELIELTWVEYSRYLVHEKFGNKTPETIYHELVDYYRNSAPLNLRTSTSMILQQYSTPVPFGYLMGLYCGVDKPGKYLEPSAGNGALTVAAQRPWFTVNEIDDLRNHNLTLPKPPFAKVLQYDATVPFFQLPYLAGMGSFDAVLTNPPFGSLDLSEEFDGYLINNLDHLMAIRALSVMKPKGRAAIIIGGHTEWDDKGRIKRGKNLYFLSYLYRRYNVEDVINVNGDMYSRMGTSFNVRIILINGAQSQPGALAPNKAMTNAETVNTFEELYDRIAPLFPEKNSLELSAQAQAQRLRILKLKSKK